MKNGKKGKKKKKNKVLVPDNPFQAEAAREICATLGTQTALENPLKFLEVFMRDKNPPPPPSIRFYQTTRWAKGGKELGRS